MRGKSRCVFFVIGSITYILTRQWRSGGRWAPFPVRQQHKARLASSVMCARRRQQPSPAQNSGDRHGIGDPVIVHKRRCPFHLSGLCLLQPMQQGHASPGESDLDVEERQHTSIPRGGFAGADLDEIISGPSIICSPCMQALRWSAWSLHFNGVTPENLRPS